MSNKIEKVKIALKNTTAEFISFAGQFDNQEHFVVCFGSWDQQSHPLVRIHSECITGDLFGSARCDCGDQLHESRQSLEVHGGILIYLRQEGRGIGLGNKLKSYALQDLGYDTFEANQILGYPNDLRKFEIAALILKQLGCTSIRLITNNPQKISDLENAGIKIAELVPTRLYLKPENREYIYAKIKKAGHTLKFV